MAMGQTTTKNNDLSANKPLTILSLSGHDPSGGAGIQADIEAARALGVGVATVITTLTIQDTRQVKKVIPIEATLVKDQALTILSDMSIDVIKIGLLGSINTFEVVYDILQQFRNIPVVLDPIIRSGSGKDMLEPETILAFSDLLFPLTHILTPNSLEARWLAPEADTLDACAQELMEDGCDYVLISGAHENTREVVNTLYGQHQKIQQFSWQRLPGEYHGSGCTLASSIAALLAQGHTPYEAVQRAQDYTWESLRQGYQPGMGQFLPRRIIVQKTEDRR